MRKIKLSAAPMSAKPTRPLAIPMPVCAPLERSELEDFPGETVPDGESGVQVFAHVVPKFSIGSELMLVSFGPIVCTLEAPTPGPGA